MIYVGIDIGGTCPGCLLERLMMFEEITSSVFKNVPLPQNKYITTPELPGLGLELDLDYIESKDES